MQPERITSRKNPLLLHVKKLLSSRSYREKNRQFAAEGTKLLQEAVRWNAEVQTVIATEGAVTFALPESVRLVLIPEDVMKSVSLMETPQGALFICNLPEKTEFTVPNSCLILDGLQDVGNVGTILRTADAFGVPVILTEDCADAYNPKTVRATMGAVFRTHPVQAGKEEIISYCKQHAVPLFVTALSERALDVRTVSPRGAVVIGSEGSGVSKVFLDAANQELIIPMTPRCESLNAAVAAAIMMWQMNGLNL